MQVNRMLLIVNPVARHGKSGQMLPVIRRLLHHQPHEIVLTNQMGHAFEIASQSSKYDLVVAAGGDGTVHEVLNGLMSIPEEERPVLGVLPTGSGNDTCRTLGVPFDLSEAIMVLATGRTRRFDIGVCNGVHFNNSFAAGFDAKVTAKAVELKTTTQLSGISLYLTALLNTVFRDLQSFKMRITFDEQAPVETEKLIIAVTNGPTYGGGFRITPDASPFDGVFDVCTIDPLSLPQTLMRLPFVIFGKHVNMKPVKMSRHTSVLIESETPLPAQIDGEVFLEDRYEIRILPAAIECMVPKESK